MLAFLTMQEPLLFEHHQKKFLKTLEKY